MTSVEKARFPRMEQKEYRILLTRSRRLCVYLNRNLREILGRLPEAAHRFAIALFEKNSMCLVKIWGDSGLIGELDDRGIGERSIWKEEILGQNAVSTGFRTGKSAFSSDGAHRAHVLQDIGICYAPATIYHLKVVDGSSEYGIAILIKDPGEDLAAYTVAANAIAYGLMMTLHMNYVVQRFYRKMSDGFLGLDSRLGSDSGEEVMVAFHDEAVTDILGIPRKDYSFCKLSELIDPLPDNAEFWELLKRGEDIRDWHIPLTCNGSTHYYIITLIHLTQPGIGAGGSYLHITTEFRRSKELSSRIGGNAVLRMEDIVGESPVMRAVIQKAKLLARMETNVILLGESGSGKDVFAQAIHNASRRKEGPFIAVNCGAIPRELIASELFGYVGGSFTGANRQGNIGKFELANGGTLFLDEIAELPYDLQASLLRAVEQKRFTRIGGQETIYADVRIISATNEDLGNMIRQHRFRADLYYRLSTSFLSIPPLRSRGEDIIRLAQHYIARTSIQMNLSFTPRLQESTKAFMLQYPWPGNVRELQNVVENVVQLYQMEEVTLRQIRENLPLMSQYMGSSYGTRQNPAGTMPHVPVRGINDPYAEFSHGIPVGSTASTVFNERDDADFLARGSGNSEGQMPGGLAARDPLDTFGSDRYHGGSFDRDPFSEIGGSAFFEEEEPRYAPETKEPKTADESSGMEADYAYAAMLRCGEKLTRRMILQALEDTGGNRKAAAARLGVSRATFYRYMSKYGLS